MGEKRYLNEAFKRVAEFINISEEQFECVLDMMSQNPYLIFKATNITIKKIYQSYVRFDSKIRHSPIRKLESFNLNTKGGTGLKFYRQRILML